MNVGGEGGGGEEIGGLVKDFDLVRGEVGEYGLLGRVDEPAHGGTMMQAVQNVFGNAGLALVGGQDFNDPVGRGCDGVGDFACGVAGNAGPSEYADVWHDGAVAKCAAQFC